VAGASIFVDRNGNGLPDAGEDTGLRTDPSGNFTGTITGSGNLIAVGGTNIDTGLRNTLTLTAPQGATVISPVTTLVQTLVSTQALTPTQAQQKVAQAFGIDATTDLLRFDPLASAGSATSATALSVQKANAQVALTAGLVENTSGVISGLAQVVAQASTPVDLSNATTLAQVTSGLNVSTELQTTIAQGNAQVQSSTSLTSVAQAQKITVTTALPSNTDWTAPTLSSFSPADGAAGVAVSSSLALTFSESVQRGSGTITLRRADGTVVEQFDAASSNRLILQGSTLTLDPSADLAGSTGFYLEVSPGAIKDLAGNGFIGSSSYDFSTQSQAGDVSAPIATKWGPADGAKAVPVGANLAITFNELIQAGTGPITLKTADGKVVETFTAANATVSGSTLTLNPTADLSIFTKYVLELGAGAVKDLAGNGNAADGRFDFKTAAVDGLYHFCVVAFGVAPGATYMTDLAEAWNYGLTLRQIVDIFTTKSFFLEPYPENLNNLELASRLVENIVKTSASTSIKAEGVSDIKAALDYGLSRGEVVYNVFGNLATLPLIDPVWASKWGNTAKQFQNQLAVARHLTEIMEVKSTDIAWLRSVLADVTPDTDVSSVENIVQIIGAIPPGG
jgi:methionine-rich copper-binding protein CopC